MDQATAAHCCGSGNVESEATQGEAKAHLAGRASQAADGVRDAGCSRSDDLRRVLGSGAREGEGAGGVVRGSSGAVAPKVVSAPF